jgi:hypothetical protein
VLKQIQSSAPINDDQELHLAGRGDDPSIGRAVYQLRFLAVPPGKPSLRTVHHCNVVRPGLSPSISDPLSVGEIKEIKL